MDPQLKQIQGALEIATADQKAELQQVENDLKELIQLTLSSLPNENEECLQESSLNDIEVRKISRNAGQGF